ncbi:hypothetical protein [Salininema proteolyticum]|uniref:Uncharacterized protein n=1 Tax=Salininema proteolyticum TaxID=1607685 RepID=A0ABV8TY67_9ACTN
MDYPELTTYQAQLLLALALLDLEVAKNADMEQAFKLVKHKAKERARLSELDLIEVEGGRHNPPYRYRLTAEGRTVADAIVNGDIVLEDTVISGRLWRAAAAQYAEYETTRLTHIVATNRAARARNALEPVEEELFAAWQALARESDKPVLLADLRDAVSDMDSTDFDAACASLAGKDRVRLVAEQNPRLLGERESDAAIRFGGKWRHYMWSDR